MQHLYETVTHKREDGLPLKIYRTTGVYLHWHEEYEFITVSGGTALCNLNGTPIELDENTAVLVQSGMLHSIKSSPGAHITAIVAAPSLWSATEDARFFDGQLAFQHIFHRSDPIDSAVIEALHRIKTIYDAPCFGYEFLIKAQFAELFATLLKHRLFTHSPQRSEKIPTEFKKLVNYIHEHYPEKITLSTLCSVSYYSTTFITNLFKTYTNLTPAEYIIQYRLSVAQRMLQNGHESNSAIALACGFNSESYFIHAFKKRFGLTPREYRKEKHKA